MSRDLPRLLLCSFDVIPAPSGWSRRVTEYIKGLTQRFSVVVLSVKTPDLTHIERYHGARLLRVPVGSGPLPTQVAAFERAVRRQLESEEYTIVHFSDPFGGHVLVEQAHQFGYKLVYEVASFPSIDLPLFHPEIAADTGFLSATAGQERVCLACADLVIASTRLMREHLASLGVRRAALRMLEPPVDLEVYKQVPLVLPDGPTTTLVYLGDHAPWQGLPTLLHAVAAARPHFDVRLMLVGARDDVETPKLEALIRELGLGKEVELQTPVGHGELMKVLCSADIGVVPQDASERNLLHGSVSALSEFFAAGRPVIVSDLPPLRSAVPDGAGLFFTAGDAASLTNQIIELAGSRERRATMGQTGRAYALAYLDAARVRGKLLDSYETLVGKLGAGRPLAEDSLDHSLSGRVRRVPLAPTEGPPLETQGADPEPELPVVIGQALEDGDLNDQSSSAATQPDIRLVPAPARLEPVLDLEAPAPVEDKPSRRGRLVPHLEQRTRREGGHRSTDGYGQPPREAPRPVVVPALEPAAEGPVPDLEEDSGWVVSEPARVSRELPELAPAEPEAEDEDQVRVTSLSSLGDLKSVPRRAPPLLAKGLAHAPVEAPASEAESPDELPRVQGRLEALTDADVPEERPPEPDFSEPISDAERGPATFPEASDLHSPDEPAPSEAPIPGTLVKAEGGGLRPAEEAASSEAPLLVPGRDAGSEPVEFRDASDFHATDESGLLDAPVLGTLVEAEPAASFEARSPEPVEFRDASETDEPPSLEVRVPETPAQADRTEFSATGQAASLDTPSPEPMVFREASDLHENEGPGSLDSTGSGEAPDLYATDQLRTLTETVGRGSELPAKESGSEVPATDAPASLGEIPSVLGTLAEESGGLLEGEFPELTPPPSLPVEPTTLREFHVAPPAESPLQARRTASREDESPGFTRTGDPAALAASPEPQHGGAEELEARTAASPEQPAESGAHEKDPAVRGWLEKNAAAREPEPELEEDFHEVPEAPEGPASGSSHAHSLEGAPDEEAPEAGLDDFAEVDAALDEGSPRGHPHRALDFPPDEPALDPTLPRVTAPPLRPTAEFAAIRSPLFQSFGATEVLEALQVPADEPAELPAEAEPAPMRVEEPQGEPTIVLAPDLEAVAETTITPQAPPRLAPPPLPPRTRGEPPSVPEPEVPSEDFGPPPLPNRPEPLSAQEIPFSAEARPLLTTLSNLDELDRFWRAQLMYGYCGPEKGHFERHAPPTNFPGREEGGAPRRTQSLTSTPAVPSADSAPPRPKT